MELKITVHQIVVKDKESGEERTISTVRTVDNIIDIIDETEKDALDTEVFRLWEAY